MVSDVPSSLNKQTSHYCNQKVLDAVHVMRGVAQELVQSVPYDCQARQMSTVHRVKVEMAHGGRRRGRVRHVEIRIIFVFFLDGGLFDLALFSEDTPPDLASFEKVFVNAEVGTDSGFLAFLAMCGSDASLISAMGIGEKGAYIRFRSTNFSMR